MVPAQCPPRWGFKIRVFWGNSQRCFRRSLDQFDRWHADFSVQQLNWSSWPRPIKDIFMKTFREFSCKLSNCLSSCVTCGTALLETQFIEVHIFLQHIPLTVTALLAWFSKKISLQSSPPLWGGIHHSRILRWFSKPQIRQFSSFTYLSRKKFASSQKMIISLNW